MDRFLITFNYSNGSWARMLDHSDDRTSAVAALLEHLGGKMEAMYWEVEDSAAHVTCGLPDSLSAKAAITAATRTGGFKDVHLHQLLTQEQLGSVVALAKNASGIYHAPGAPQDDDF